MLLKLISLCLALHGPLTVASANNDALKVKSRQDSQSGPIVDLGYEIYQGVADASTGQNTFFGIRYAAPPTGKLRFQAPQPPVENRSKVISGASFGPRCPQAYNTVLAKPCQGLQTATTLPEACANDETFAGLVRGDEDCLYLSVYAPANATKLPVLVWIHGGGYGSGEGMQDLSATIQVNNNSFIGVAIQYRLGAFGFLASDEVHRRGVVNAGLLDQEFALRWVQDYIHLFGGDPRSVTISGESAGGGSVMLIDMAYGGGLGDKLFKQSIAASPYLQEQYGYSDWAPSQAYYSLAEAVGCYDGLPYSNSSSEIFDCLVLKDSLILQSASATVSGSSRYGTWAFAPVTDGSFIEHLPSKQLQEGRVNGQRILTANNANEGSPFVPRNISTERDLVAWVRNNFPLFTPDDITALLRYYPSSNDPVDPSAPRFPTLGDSGPTAINQSDYATGQQQRAFNIYAETAFICPSYWLSEAYSSDFGSERASYRYQFSIPPAPHGFDVSAYFSPDPSSGLPSSSPFGPDFRFALMRIWGNFITRGNPSIEPLVANGVTTLDSTTNSPASQWPAFSASQPFQLNLNQTGGTPVNITWLGGLTAHGTTYNATSEGSLNVTDLFDFLSGKTKELPGAGLNVSVTGFPVPRNAFTEVNARDWEGGRGERCDFWKSIGASVPE